MGDAIRAAAPFNHAVMLAESDESLGLWFYADRPFKQNVWDPATFEHRMTDGRCDLQFKLTEPWHDRPAAVIVPSIRGRSEVAYRISGCAISEAETSKFITYNIEKN